MIQLKPTPYNKFSCPECGSSHIHVHKSVFPGIHVMADAECKDCGMEFYQDYPVGHAVDNPTAVGKRSQHFYIPESNNWKRISVHLKHAFDNVHDEPIKIERQVHKECKEVVILNTLDRLYGHVLLKLFNAQHYFDHAPEDLGLVLIIPRMFAWLIPEGCAEVWIVDVKLGESRKWLSALDEFVNQEMARFDRVYLSEAYSHPDFSKLDMSRFIGVKPFDLEEYETRRPQVTIIAREDRLWFESPLAEKLYKPFKKLGLQKFFVKRQNRLINRTIRQLKKAIPHMKIYVVGLGGTGKISQYATDLRSWKIDLEVEKKWIDCYAKSHTVIGVHGSNMLLPTAMSAGCVEILPEGRYRNMVQDLAVRYYDRRQLFFYRFAEQYVKPGSVTAIVREMLDNYPGFYRNMVKNLHKPEEFERLTDKSQTSS
ncbi:MAG: hypothetical protein AAGI38_09855 [Bacteroidota bacterium]